MSAPDVKRIARKLLSLYMAVAISVAAVLTVSAILVLPAYVLGHADMDITFDIREPGGPGSRDGSAVYGFNEAKGITCNDASAEMADGKWWIRCRYVADKVSYATDYLRANGLEVGGTYARIVMQPAGGSWINLVCAAFLVACLGLIWSWRDASRLRRELGWIAGNKGRSLLAAVVPGVVTMAAAGAKLGLTPEMAMQLARATVSGSGELLRQSSEPAAQLRINVTSPGGTTAEALKVLMADDGIQPVFDKALAAASRRSKELAG